MEIVMPEWGDYDRDHPSVEDVCQECGCDLYPEERDGGLCHRCYADYLSQCEDDEAYERFHEVMD